MKEPVYPQNVQRPAAPYSPAIVHPAAARTVYVSGQLGADPQTGELPDSFEAQAEQALRNVEAILLAAGSSLAATVKVTVLMADMADFAVLNAIYGRFFPEPRPARTAFQAAALPRNARIEIEAVAIIEG